MMPYMSASINKSMSRLVLLLALLIKTCNSVALSDNDTVLTQKEAVDGCLSDHKSYLIPQKFMKENLYVRKEIISQMQNTTAWIDGEKHDIGCTTGTCYRILRQRTEMATRYPFICGTSILGLKANVTFDKAKAMCENEANVTVNEVMGTMEKQKIESDGNFWLFNVKEINGNKTCASIYEEENFTLSTECRPCDDKMMAVCIEPGMIPSYREVLILSLERQVLPELVIQGQHSESTAETQRPSTEAQEKQDTSPFSMAYYVEDNTAQSHSLNNTIEFIVLVAVNGFFIVVSLFVMILLWKRVSRIERLRNLDTNKFSGSNMLLDVPEHIYNSCSEETFRKGYQAKNKKKVKVGRENKDRLYFKIPADRSCCKTIDVPDRIGLAEENPYAELSDDLKRSFDDLHHGLCVADVANNRASYFDMSKGKLPHDLGKINHINPASTITDDELDDTDVAPTVKTGRDAVAYPNESGTLNSFFPIPAIVVDSSKTGKGIEKHKLRIKQLGNGTIKTRKAMDTENKGNNNFLEVPKNTKRHTNNGIRLPAMEDAYMRMNSPDMTK